MLAHLCGRPLEFRMILHLFSGNIMLPDLLEGKRSTVQIGSVVPIHISVYHRPLAQFGEPYLVDDVAVLVVPVFRQTSDISGVQSGGKKQFECKDTMKPAVECRGDILRVFPKADGIDVLRPFFLIVVRNIGRDELADGECFCPGVCISIV